MNKTIHFLVLLSVAFASSAFVIPHKQNLLPTKSRASTSENDAQEERPWFNRGLLISSFNDGLRPNPEAQDFLQRSLIRALLMEERTKAEQAVESSAIQSPCCGPNLAAIDRMMEMDTMLERISNHPDPVQLLTSDASCLRFVYIPTAMYALRRESNNTPGKQRQRARADGKKRRNEIVQLVKDILGNINVHVVTLDFDDGSIKQPEGSDDILHYPTNGKGALRDWLPHFVYVEGGNTFWLYHCLDKGEWKDDLVEGCRNAVYCGNSAGAIVMGAFLETACWKGWDDPSIVPGMETYDDWKNVEGLGMVGDMSFFPHMSEEWESLVDEKLKDLTLQVSCLGEEDVYCVDGSTKQTRVVSAPAAVVSD